MSQVIGCKKSKNEILVDPNISLTDKTKQEVRSLIAGKWDLLYTINPNPPYYNYLPNASWDIRISDSLTEVYNNHLYAKSKFKRISGNDNRWNLNPMLAYTLDSLKTDTLISHYEWTGSKSVLKKQ
jgi:hypothetical protein